MKKIMLSLSAILICAITYSQNRITTDLSGGGWKLWKDSDTTWKQDAVFLPPVDVATLPIHPPTGGWDSLYNGAINVNVPGTAEEYLQKVSGPEGDINGVSWWYRTIHIPDATTARKILIRFEAARYRSEVFINQQLVGYDLIGNTPFEVDITNAVKPGMNVQLAVRITDAGGNFDWTDGANIKWGKVNVPGSHGFGGITGRVQLIACSPVYVDELYIQNTPEYHKVNAYVYVNNTTTESIKTNLIVSVSEKEHPEIVRFDSTLKDVVLKPGLDSILVKVDAPNAKLWDVEHPNLYVLNAIIDNKDKNIADSYGKIFGFRWFELSGIGSDAMYRLNGKRIVLRTSISWGFWPVNGIFPTAQLAEKQIRLAKAMGLNMLNFHRCIGQPSILELADELGLLYYEEPGNYMSGNLDTFARACLKEKLCRMVRRDRSHPSMVIYNMQNEMRDVDSLLFISHQGDMRAAHIIDPSRTITRTSGWASGDDVEDQAKLHARPFDTLLYKKGWYDYHRAPGPPVWMQSFYKDPTNFYGYTNNKKEIVYWGEEGALSTPSRLELIKKDIEKNPNVGWDGAMYLKEYDDFDTFIKSKNLTNVFPTVDALTLALGKISYEHQGRKIENIRLGNVSDGYAINGWESEIIENHSGIVDCYRNPKGDPGILAYYNQPLYVAVKAGKQVVELPDDVAIDFYAINEKNLTGKFTLVVTATDPMGKKIFSKKIPVTLTGGDVYGQLLADNVYLSLANGTDSKPVGGMYQIKAAIIDAAGEQVATGHDEILGVDWKSSPVNGNGAVWDYAGITKQFLTDQKSANVVDYTDDAKKLDWLVVSRSPLGGDMHIVPNEQLLDVTGKVKGLTATYFVGADFDKQVAQQVDKNVNLVVNAGATPHANVPTTTNYSVRWEGQIMPPSTGTYNFNLEVAYGGEGVLIVDGKTFSYDKQAKRIVGSIELEAGKPVSIKVALQHRRHSGACRLFWSVPDAKPIDAQAILDRVKNDGTTLIIIDAAAAWMDLIAKNTSIKYTDKFTVGTNWLGGVAFAKKHPLFKDLPTNQGLSWPYEAVVKSGNERIGLIMEGEELVAGSYHCFPQKLGTSVGVIDCGKGKIVFSTLDIYNNLQSNESVAGVAKKLLCNYIDFANGSKK